MDKTKNVFISHIHEDDSELQAFKDLLGTRGYSIRDSSIDSSCPNDATSEAYIKQGILSPCIQWAGTVIVLISPQTHTSTWVNWETEYAGKLDKRVIGVYVRGGTESNVPAAFDKWGRALVGWNAQSIIDAIEGRIDDWRSPSGALVTRDVVRFTCQ
jgi:hypothetical protein